MDTETLHQKYRTLALEDDAKAKRIKQLELANMELTAALFDRGEQARIYKELAEGVLYKSVDKYLQGVYNSESSS